MPSFCHAYVMFPILHPPTTQRRSTKQPASWQQVSWAAWHDSPGKTTCHGTHSKGSPGRTLWHYPHDRGGAGNHRAVRSWQYAHGNTLVAVLWWQYPHGRGGGSPPPCPGLFPAFTAPILLRGQIKGCEALSLAMRVPLSNWVESGSQPPFWPSQGHPCCSPAMAHAGGGVQGDAMCLLAGGVMSGCWQGVGMRSLSRVNTRKGQPCYPLAGAGAGWSWSAGMRGGGWSWKAWDGGHEQG